MPSGAPAVAGGAYMGTHGRVFVVPSSPAAGEMRRRCECMATTPSPSDLPRPLSCPRCWRWMLGGPVISPGPFARTAGILEPACAYGQPTDGRLALMEGAKTGGESRRNGTLATPTTAANADRQAVRGDRPATACLLRVHREGLTIQPLVVLPMEPFRFFLI